MSAVLPKISVVMPVYNNERYLRTAIESVLSQTLGDFEFIVISESDTSSESRSIIDSYSDGRINHVRNESRLGMIESLNVGLKLARGEFIARMDADDVCLPDRFAHQLEYLDSHPDVGIVGSASRVVDDSGSTVLIDIRPHEAVMSRWMSLFGPPVSHPSVMVRTQLMRQIGGYDPSMICEDYDLWIRALDVTKIENMPEILLVRRVHDKSSTLLQQEKVDCTHIGLSQRILASLLKRDVDVETVRLLKGDERDTESGSDAQRIVGLLRELFEAFVKRYRVSPSDARMVRAEVAWRICKLGVSMFRRDPLVGIRILVAGLRFSRCSFPHIARRVVRRMATKRKTRTAIGVLANVTW
jgi:glycosyltransferase involved in cell wall biosynthesis